MAGSSGRKPWILLPDFRKKLVGVCCILMCRVWNGDSAGAGEGAEREAARAKGQVDSGVLYRSHGSSPGDYKKREFPPPVPAS